MPRQTPPLEAIEAFVAVAHAGGLRAGAADLALSPSAVSRRIVRLEGFLGTTLFERTDQGLRLAAAGERYLAMVEPAVTAIGRASTMVGADPRRIVLATSHSLATRWLAPRLATLKYQEEIDLEIIPTRDPDVLRSGEAQFGVWGSLTAVDLPAEPIVSIWTRPVAAPRLADGRTPPTDENALRDFPLLTVCEPRDLWRRWLAAIGVDDSGVTLLSFASLSLMYEAAAAGLGIALAVPMLCEAQLRSGTLVTCGRALPIGESYVLYRNSRRAGRTPTETRLVHWLRRETALSVAQFDAIAA